MGSVRVPEPGFVPRGAVRGRGDFDARRVKIRRDSGGARWPATTLDGFLRILCLARVAPLLLQSPPSVIVFRATLLSIVLLFAVGPSASLLCNTRCTPNPAAVSECHHTDHSPTGMVNDDSCKESVQGNVILVKDDPRRALTGCAGHVTAVAHSQVALAAAMLRAVGNPGPVASDLQRPLTTPLRI